MTRWTYDHRGRVMRWADHWLTKLGRDILVGVLILLGLGYLTLTAADVMPVRCSGVACERIEK